MNTARAASLRPVPEPAGTPIEPDVTSFTRLYEAGTPQVVWTRLVADLETPVSAMLKLAHERPNSFLLELVEGGAVRGRYSIIGCEPDVIWRARGAKAEINRSPEAHAEAFSPSSLPALQSLRELLAESAIELPSALPPMAAGIFGYMGYDTVRLIENLPSSKPDKLGLPDAIMVRPTLIVVFDGVKDEMIVVTPVRPLAGVSAQAAYARAAERIASALDRLEQPLPHVGDLGAEPEHPMPKGCTTPAALYAEGRTRQGLHRGGRHLPSRAQPALRSSVLATLFFALSGAPPRQSFSLPLLPKLRGVRGRGLKSRDPGSRAERRRHRQADRRHAAARHDPDEDKALAEELLADAKERAEHLMLLDLGRNDVGRVAEIGSVRVTDSFFLEYYSQVMHIVSNVEGKIDPKRDAIDALMAGFPAGTVSGAPKVRAMEIIDELEDEKRGLYAGCVGYFSANGEMDSCIVLRTSVVKDGTMYVQAGAGVVADSVPEREQAECVSKAAALFRAAEEAVRFATRARRRS